MINITGIVMTGYVVLSWVVLCIRYHAGAVFVVLFASLLGTCIPIVAHHFPKTLEYPFQWICGKHIGTGKYST